MKIKHADIKLGYTCNNNCLHCVIADQRERAILLKGTENRSPAEAAGQLRDAYDNGCRVVTFTGGEPTLRKDLLSLINEAKKLGFFIGLQTNGRLFSYPKIAKEFSGLGVRFIIAIHGSSKEEHEAITRTEGSFANTIAGIKNLVALKEGVTAKIVMSKLNILSLGRIAEKLLLLGVRDFNWTFPHALGNARKYAGTLLPRYGEAIPNLVRAFEAIESSGIEGCGIRTEGIPACFLGKYEGYMSERIYAEFFDTEVRQLDSEKRDWSRDRVVENKVKFNKCVECRYYNECEGVWKEYPQYFGEDEFVPVR
ncbi:MAG: radical SAM protein [Deltaproteobacteria bacterium]|nr:radical SAM protein [Deltaproteobacteria bacterium]